MKRYLIVIEETGSGYTAYSPDLPDCVTTGLSREEVVKKLRAAISFRLDGLRQEGEPIPEPHTYPAYVELPS
jgi:predicted RNase H-like HicB family nuclease